MTGDAGVRPAADLPAEPLVITTDEVSGFPVVSVGRPVTSQDVADLIG